MPETKRILITQDALLHYRKSLYNALSEYYDVTVLHSGTPSAEASDSYREIIVPRRKIGPFFWQPGILGLLFSGRYDVMIAMFDIRWLSNIAPLIMKQKIRFIYWGHRYGKSKVANRIRDLLMTLCDAVILYYDDEIERIQSRNNRGVKLFVAPNTIHVPNHSDGSSAQKDSIIYVGRAQKRKKVHLLLKAFQEVLDRLPTETKIDIIGPGKENDFLRILSKQLGISDRVRFHGETVNPERLRSFFHRAYAYVSPGHIGLGALHSFAYGVPVITCKNEIHAHEIVNLRDNENAILYNTYHDLKDSILRVCTNKALASRLGHNAFLFYKHHRKLDIMVSGFRNAIENGSGC